MHTASSSGGRGVFDDAMAYDRTINWSARFRRELPVLTDVLGPPGQAGVVDAGCGSGRHAVAMAKRGYRVVGVDASDAMLQLARSHATRAGARVTFVHTGYADIVQSSGDGFDGVYCLGNALCAAGSRQGVADAIAQFAACLRTGGRLFLQILNYVPMRTNAPCVRGPRVSVVDDREHVSVRVFHFNDQTVHVTNITLSHDDGWQQHAHSGVLYALGLEELEALCAGAHLSINHRWGSYARDRFDVHRSTDLIIAATRV